jgi:hypothetical protein
MAVQKYILYVKKNKHVKFQDFDCFMKINFRFLKKSFTLAPERLPCGRSLQAEDRILPEEHFELAF